MIPEEHFEKIQKLVDIHNYGNWGLNEYLTVFLGIPIIIWLCFLFGYSIAKLINEIKDFNKIKKIYKNRRTKDNKDNK